MALGKNNAISGIIKIITSIACVAMLVIAIVLYKASISDLLIFLAFFVFYIQLPGMLIAGMLKIKVDHISTQLLFSLFTGWALNIALYFISDLIRTNLLLIAFGPILSIIYVIGLFKRSENKLLVNKFKYSNLSACLLAFFALSLLFALLNTQFVYLSPEVTSYTYMNPDKAYHLGLIDSLSHDYPLESPWIQGRYIKYHIFTEVLLSIPVRLFGLSADAVLISGGPYLTVYAFCLSIYSLFVEFSKRADRAGLYSLLVLLSNIFIGKYWYSSIAYRFIFVNENAAGYGVAGAIACLILAKYWYNAFDNGEKSRAWLILLIAFIMLETGIKGPMGAVVVAALWGTYIVGLIMRKVPAKAILPLVLVAIGFIAIYATILGMKGQSNGSGAAVITFGTITNICFWKTGLIAAMKTIGFPGMLRLIIILLTFYLCMTTAFCIPFAVGYIRELILVFSKKKVFDYPRITIYAATLVGLIAMFVLNYSGHSQIYFGLVSIFFVPLISFWLFEDLEDREVLQGIRSRSLRVMKVIFIIMMAISTASLAYYYGHKFKIASGYLDAERTYNHYLSISNDEYDAMKWIEANTPADSLLATDRYYSVSPSEYTYDNRWSNRFFLYAAYSNRFCYISGSGYNLGANEWPIRQEMIETNNQLFDPSNTDRAKLADSLGIDYVIVSKRFNDPGDLSGNGYALCYNNNDIDIYKVVI